MTTAAERQKSARLSKALLGVVKIDGRLVPFTDATQDVELFRTVKDIRTAKRGNVRECADAQCGIRSRKRFPHAFHGIIVFPTRAYVVDKLAPDGEPAHVVRYARQHRDQIDIEAFDRYGPSAIEPRPIRLKAIYPSQRSGASPRLNRHPARKRGSKRKVLLRHINRRGVARRFLLANGGVAAV